MRHSRLSFAKRRRLNTAIKVAALFAALAFVTVVLEQPRLTASPKQSQATVEQSLYSPQQQTMTAADPAAAGESIVRSSASEQLPVYFPGQFAPPRGEVEAQPPSF
ncbi:MAG: hypothetical protein M3023_07685 [Pseudomonadota bacterium]|nr:hypothetical protein [Pseudomonadota bacterium]